MPEPGTAARARTGRPIRVMMVDDSAFARAVVARVLGPCTDLALVAEATGALDALRQVAEAAPDVVLLDLQMPGVDGLQALPELIARGRDARVLVVSATCGAGAEATVRALRLGAADTLAKPGGGLAGSAFAAELVSRIRRLGARPEPVVHATRRTETLASPTAVGIGASTGGVHAMGELLAALPASFAAPLFVTQHLPLAFTPYFAGQLAEAAGRPVRVASDGLRPVAGEILLAPGDAHLTLMSSSAGMVVRLRHERAASGCLPSVDPMFASLATGFGVGAVGILLSGMGRDGADGAAALVAAGGRVAVQDQASSVVWGMPGTAARRGLASAVLPPAALAGWLARLGRDRWS